MQHPDFLALLQGLREGDPQLLTVLFEQYGRTCVRTLQRRTGCSAEEAQDVLTDALLVIRRNVLSGQIDTFTNASGYLYSVCYHVYRNQQQKQERQRQQQAEAMEQWYEAGLFEMPAHERSQDYQGRLLHLARKALAQLGPECQQVITDFYLNQLSMEDIARKMGWSSARVAKNQKYRCMKKLVQYAQALYRKKETDA